MTNSDGKILSRLIRNMKKRGEEPLTPLIDEYLLKRDGHPNRLQELRIPMVPRVRPGGRLSPSSMGGCLRQAAFKFVGMPGYVRKDPQRELIFDQGNWQHYKWQFRMKDMEAVLGPQKIKVLGEEDSVQVPELYVAGNSDNLLRLLLSSGRQRRFVVDYKSIKDSGFQYVSRRDEPIEEHADQLTTYIAAHGASWGMILYDNKDNQDFRIFVVPFDQNRWTAVQEWGEEVIRMLNAEKLPPMHPDCQAGNFLWNRCPYAGWCYGNKTPVKIRRRMYSEFPGVDEAWEAGNRAIQDAEGGQQEQTGSGDLRHRRGVVRLRGLHGALSGSRTRRVGRSA